MIRGKIKEKNMREFVITTDNTADLPDNFVKEKNLEVMSLTYMIDGQTYDAEHELPYGEFYDKMRKGSMPTTSQVNPKAAKEVFLPHIKEGKDVLHLAFSSGLSGSCGSAQIAARELMEEYPDAKVIVVDTLCASLGEGLVVYYALKMQKEGKSLEEIQQWVEENKLHVCHNVTVDDLFHLHRGGRISKTSAILGSIINIKPMIHMDQEGKLQNIGKVRGRKKALITVVDWMEERLGGYRDQNEVIFISHGDCLEDAQFVQEEVKKRLGYTQFMINRVGPTIGAHSGPGTIALCFLGEYR